jgi:hypothetical protein
MSDNQKTAPTSTLSSSPEVERNQARAVWKLFYELSANVGAAELNINELFRPHRANRLMNEEREALLKMHMSLRGWRRYAEELERRWKA